MSASLVGSEMCIRDRRPRRGWTGFVKPITMPLEARDCIRCRVARKPVSYTHLTLPTICSV
eukprot:830663-Alexandrium_andersonii.AAC.1